MDILIPLGDGSLYGDIELRYCLRGVEKFLSGVDQVFIIGRKPDWLTNVIFIPCDDLPEGENRDLNIYRKILLGCGDDRLGSNFLYMSDDHFLLSNFVADTFPYYYKGKLLDTITQYASTLPYAHTLKNTYELLISKSATLLNYNLHCPVIYSKVNFHCPFPVSWKKFGYAMKSVYCNYYKIPGVLYTDLKIKEALTHEQIFAKLQDRLFFTIANRALKGEMKEVLETLYPFKSKYET